MLREHQLISPCIFRLRGRFKQNHEWQSGKRAIRTGRGKCMQIDGLNIPTSKRGHSAVEREIHRPVIQTRAYVSASQWFHERREIFTKARNRRERRSNASLQKRVERTRGLKNESRSRTFRETMIKSRTKRVLFPILESNGWSTLIHSFSRSFGRICSVWQKIPTWNPIYSST